MLRRLLNLIRNRCTIDDELRDEMQFHLDMRTQLNEQQGLDPQGARDAARKQFGNSTLMQEDSRRMHVSQFLETVAQDVRYALRGFLRAPVFTITALCAIALGIGASTAVFSVVDRILFRSLPYPNEDRLVWLGMGAPIFGGDEFLLGPDFLDWRDASKGTFDAFTSFSGQVDCDVTDREPVRLHCGRVDAGLLPALGIQPLVGRNFTSDEDAPKAPKTAILSFGLWKSRFGGDAQVTGKTLSLDGSPARIVGVLPPNFELPNMARPDLLVPQALDPVEQRRRDRMAILTVFARMKPGVTVAQANSALQPLFQTALQSVPPQFRKEVTLRISPLRDRQTRDSRTASWILLGAVLCVLLIACANVANLLLARAAGRERERSIRAALGAHAARLARQNLTESLVLGVAGGCLGVVVAALLLRVLTALAPEGIPRLAEAHLDGRVLLFSLLLAVLSSAAFGIAPALKRVSRHMRLRHSLVTAQIAISLVLLAGSGLLLRSLWNLQNVQLGLNTEHVITAQITLGQQRYAGRPQQHAFWESLEQRVNRIPGLEAAAFSDSLPPTGRAMATIFSLIAVDGRPAPTGRGTGGMVTFRFVTPGYFQTLRIPIVRGRAFAEGDRSAPENLIVLSHTLAGRLFPNEDALGRRVKPGGSDIWYTVCGIACDVKNAGLIGKDDPEFYLLMKHREEDSHRAEAVLARTSADPRLIAGLIRSEVQELDPTLPVKIETMQERVGTLLERPRFNTILLALFAGIGLLLAAIGLYGVLAFLVAQRSRELGVRIALGATQRQITGLVLSYATRWTIAGTLIGTLGAFLATRYLATLLYGVRSRDPETLGVVIVVLVAVAMLAAWVPSRRAARLDPAQLLRHD